MPAAVRHDRLKVAVVGAGMHHSPDGREGWAVRAHLPALKALPALFEPIAVCTTRQQSAQEAARHFDIPHAFDDVAAMLARLPQIDVVCVSVRPALHFQVVMAALAAGKHVYCEQPLGLSTAQAREMYALAKRNRLRTIVGHQSHHEPAALHMARLVRDGYIGRPLAFGHSYFVSNYITPRPPHRQWLFQAAMGGHPGYRSGHSLDRVHSVLGQYVTAICADMAVQVPSRPLVGAEGTLRSDQVDHMNYLLRVGGKVMGTMQTSFTAWFGTGNRFELYGSEGMLMLASGDSPQLWIARSGEGDPTRGESRLFGARSDMERLLHEPTAPERLQRQFREIEIPESLHRVTGLPRGRAAFLVAQTWAAFGRAILGGEKCGPDFEDKLRIHCVWDAAERSVRERAWVDVDYGPLQDAA
jgi:predicted dehydrogenase